MLAESMLKRICEWREAPSDAYPLGKPCNRPVSEHAFGIPTHYAVVDARIVDEFADKWTVG